MPQLHVQTGDGQERTVDLGDTPVSFGRADDNQVVLAEQKASRRHCTFRPVRGNWRVVDEQSSNGTWLGGKPVLSARLQPGDEIEIGDTVITFVAEPSELPKPDHPRPPRRARRIRTPWEALVGAFALAAVAWFGTRALADGLTAQESAAWKRFANARVEAAAIPRPEEDAYKAELARISDELRPRATAAAALTIVNAALARGLPPVTIEKQLPEWANQLEQIEAGRSRMTAAERRAGLHRVLARFTGDEQAVLGIVAVLKADETAVRERGTAEAARLIADADQAMTDLRFGRAFDDWTAWLAAAPEISRQDERAVATKMAEARDKARAEAEAARVQFEDQLKEGRLAAATSSVDAVIERLRGTGWDVWLAARTRRFGGGSGDGAAGTPVAGGPRETDAAREKLLAKDKVDRARNSANALAARRRFADAAAVLSEAAGEVTDAAVQADLHTLADDFTAKAGVLTKLLAAIRDDAARFGNVPFGSGLARVTGATDTAILLGDAKGADPRPVGVDAVPSGVFVTLFDKANLEAPSFVPAALFLHEIGETAAYTAWMRKALAVEAIRVDASAIHARVLGAKLPDGGYFPHPNDPKLIVSLGEKKAIENAKQIAELTAQLVKVVDKIAVTKQAKQVESVAQAYVKLEGARKFALELIFDEVKYFYPYRTRMKEYMPVQLEVDKRVDAVREAWEEKASAKVRTDSALEKLLKQADDLAVEIVFLGGDVQTLIDRVESVRMYLGRELTVQTFYASKQDLALLDYNKKLMQENAKVKGAISDPERDQVRITNEYRIMFGHRRVLRLHEKLVLSSHGHSEDMSKVGFFDHTSPVPGKTTFVDRMLLAGYPNTPCSENIAAGASDAQGAHNSWCHSSGHHRNLLMPQWSELGSGQSGRYWTQNFGFAMGDEQVGGDHP